MQGKHRLVLVLVLVVVTSPPAVGAEADRGEECWKASFTEQRSGAVREPRSSSSGFINSYDGDFKWMGEPKSAAALSDYVFCFRKRIDDGGVLIVNDKRIELDRLGSVRRPPVLHESAGYSYSSTRDVREFPTLYGIFSAQGRPDSSLEVQLDRTRRVASVVASTRQGTQRVVTYMQGPAVSVVP